tara:strand:+ start:270 stop:1412 length:1143 start_codon:yes stop_codon:yes gene_type:complete
MKIAFIPSTFLPWHGGAEIQAHNTANKLAELGHDVDIFLLDKTKIDNRRYNTIKLNKLLINIIFILKYYFRISFNFILEYYFNKICINKKYDVWHFQSVNFKTLMYLKVLKQLKQKVVVTFHGADIQKDESILYGYRFDKKYEDFLSETIHLFDKVFAISDDVVKELNFFNFPKEKIIKIPNSIEIKKIKNVGNNNFDPKKLNIITVARFYEKKKGLDLIEKISDILIKNNISFTWTLVGRNSNLLLKKKFIKDNKNYFNIKDEIKNTNEIFFPHSELINLYKSNNVYANLARIESFGITIIEAIAAGLHVVSFNTKGANEIVINNLNGYIVDEYTPEKMANTLINKFNDNSFNKINESKEIMKYELELNTKLLLKNYAS